jgi:hypothetical protein
MSNRQGFNIDDYTDFITDAGRTVPGLNLIGDGIEFFVHSPFAEHCDDNTVIDRNDASIVFQVRFLEGQTQTDLILSADTTHEIWQSIVKVTKYHKREDRLRWNIFKLPHHCSYLALGPDKGKDKTAPVAGFPNGANHSRRRSGRIVAETMALEALQKPVFRSSWPTAITRFGRTPPAISFLSARRVWSTCSLLTITRSTSLRTRAGRGPGSLMRVRLH